MKMRKKGLSDAQDRTGSSYGARPACRVYYALPDTVHRALAYLFFYFCSPSLNSGCANTYIYARGFKC